MTLTEEIKNGFAELKALFGGKPQTTADIADQIKSFETKLAGLQTSSDKLSKDLEARDVTIKDLNAQVTKLTEAGVTKDKEIIDLKAKDKSAGEKAVDMIAATGLNAEQLPGAGAKDASTTGAKASLYNQYLALCAKDSVAAGKFYAENADNKEFWKR